MGDVGYYDFHARQYDPKGAIFTTQDPHAENYYSTSQYAYVGNNPINAIDPDGMDIWVINAKGEIEYTRNDEYDEFRILGADGNQTASMRFDYGTVQYSTHKITEGNYDVSMFEIGGDNNSKATNLFEMLADNTNVEWSDTKATVNDENVSIVGTTHSADTEATAGIVMETSQYQDYTITAHSHSHPEKTDGNIASPADAKFKINLTKQYSGGVKTFVYFKGPKRYRQYGIDGKYRGVFNSDKQELKRKK